MVAAAAFPLLVCTYLDAAEVMLASGTSKQLALIDTVNVAVAVAVVASIYLRNILRLSLISLSCLALPHKKN
jgi:hypothetical protein